MIIYNSNNEMVVRVYAGTVMISDDGLGKAAIRICPPGSDVWNAVFWAHDTHLKIGDN